MELLTVLSLAERTKPGRVSFGLILRVRKVRKSSCSALINPLMAYPMGSARSPCFPARRLMMLPHQTMNIPEVCIIGGGMGGLGLPVTLFEARDRVGGRVSSPRVNRYGVD